MNSYQIGAAARSDLNEILAFREDRYGEQAAADLQEKILAACARLAVTPGLGHLRTDLTDRPYYFYTLDSYLIVYARLTDPLTILAILHSSRNLSKLLRLRLRP